MEAVTLPGFPSSPRRQGGEGRAARPPDGSTGEPAAESNRAGDTRRLDQPQPPPPRDQQPPPPRAPKVTVTRVAVSRAKELSQRTVTRIGNASRADGADRSGLTRLIWLNVVQTGGDAMIAVALANTIFFSAATSQQRGNVALYLAITMAPFAVIAPIIGPLLDKLQYGRRYALAGTMLGRAVLAWVMAQNFHNIGFYPAVLGFLVLSKAYNVLKAACVPRVLPERLTLVTTNARLSIFALGGTILGGGLAGGIVKISDSAWTLRTAAAVFIAAAILSLKMPKHVDSSRGERTATLRVERPTGRRSHPAMGRPVITALEGSAALRGLSGFLTLFLAFLLQHKYHGFDAAVALGALAVAAGGGSFLGTAAGARLKLARPDRLVLWCAMASAAMCLITAVIYSVEFAVGTALIAGMANSLGKLSLDAIIQRDVPDSMRASAFGRSETALQLAWVIGAAIGIALPLNGRLGFAVAAALVGAAVALVIFLQRGGQLPSLRRRRSSRDFGSPGGAGTPAPQASGAGRPSGGAGQSNRPRPN
jgi:MFS family permease